MIWEFAQCDRKDLEGLKPEDLRGHFYAADNAGASQTFGAKWYTNAILVSRGEIILARLVGDTNIVYALHFLEQKGDIGVKFRTINMKRDQ